MNRNLKGGISMKRLAMSITLLFIIATVSIIYAQETVGTARWSYCPYCGRYLGPQRDYGMGPGMAGGQGMMSSGAYGMGLGMMGGSCDYEKGKRIVYQSEKCQKFLDETAELRKELHEKRFAYYEAIRDPKTTTEEITKLEKELQELQGKIYAKKPFECIW